MHPLLWLFTITNTLRISLLTILVLSTLSVAWLPSSSISSLCWITYQQEYCNCKLPFRFLLLWILLCSKSPSSGSHGAGLPHRLCLEYLLSLYHRFAPESLWIAVTSSDATAFAKLSRNFAPAYGNTVSFNTIICPWKMFYSRYCPEMYIFRKPHLCLCPRTLSIPSPNKKKM